MTNVNILSGFLGAGKTTLIKKLLGGAFKDETVVLLENEYGEVGIDGGFMKDSGIQVTELNSGCICCTLVGDFSKALEQLIGQYNPDRILIEPSGVGKLSDIRGVVRQNEAKLPIHMAGCATVVDVNKCKMYARNFGEFFIDQIQSAETIILSRTQFATQAKIDQAIELIRQYNPKARIITTPWDELTAELILKTIEAPDFLLNADEFAEHLHEHHHHHHHHHDEEEEHEHHDDDDDDEEEEHEHCHHHHDDDDDEHEHCHHHHDDDDEEEHEHCHHHHDDDDKEEHEHCHHHHHHDGHCCCHDDHDADEVFENIGVETAKKFDRAALEEALKQLDNAEKYGTILRAKGILPLTDGKWVQFDYVPEEYEFRDGTPDYTGRLCVIGAEIKEDALKELFGL